MTTKSSIENFLSQKNIAVVGVSRNRKKFGNVIYRELKKKGYNLFPINPNAEKIEGANCYPDLLSLPEKVDQAQIKRVWLQQGSQSDEAIKYCKENGVDFISNECILMFAEPAGYIHRAHR